MATAARHRIGDRRCGVGARWRPARAARRHAPAERRVRRPGRRHAPRIARLRDAFASVDNFLNILEASSFLGLVAVGMTFVIIGGGIDLSVGSLLALSAVLAAFGSQYGTLVAVALPLGVCGADRPGQRRCSSRGRGWPPSSSPSRRCSSPAASPSRCPTRATRSSMIDDQSGRDLARPGLAPRDPDADHHRRLVFLVGWLVLDRTRYGMAVTAIGGSEDAARLMGLPDRASQDHDVLGERAAGRAGGPAGRGTLVLRSVDDRRRSGAPGDRRRRDRRDAP